MLKKLLYVGNTREEKDQKNKRKTIKKMVIRTYISIIILNENGLNAPTKRQDRLNGYKNRPIYILSTRDPLQT